MKKITSIICLLSLIFVLFLTVGCESLNGPEGKYVYRDSTRLDVYSIVFEDKKATLYSKNTELGTFDYEYKKDEQDKNIGYVTVKSDEYPWTFEYNYADKELFGDIENNGLLYLFVKVSTDTITD